PPSTAAVRSDDRDDRRRGPPAARGGTAFRAVLAAADRRRRAVRDRARLDRRSARGTRRPDCPGHGARRPPGPSVLVPSGVLPYLRGAGPGRAARAPRHRTHRRRPRRGPDADLRIPFGGWTFDLGPVEEPTSDHPIPRTRAHPP